MGVQRGARVPLVLPPPPVDQVLLCVAQVRSWSTGRGGGFLPLRCQGARSLYPGLRVLEFTTFPPGAGWLADRAILCGGPPRRSGDAKEGI